MLSILVFGIRPRGAAGTPPSSEPLRLRVEQLHEDKGRTVRDVRVLEPDAVSHFFQNRNFTPAWQGRRARPDPAGHSRRRAGRARSSRLSSGRHRVAARGAGRFAGAGRRSADPADRCRRGPREPRPLREGPAVHAGPPMEHGPARRRAAARSLSRRHRSGAVARRRHRCAQVVALHLQGIETGAGRTEGDRVGRWVASHSRRPGVEARHEEPEDRRRAEAPRGNRRARRRRPAAKSTTTRWPSPSSNSRSSIAWRRTDRSARRHWMP